MGLDNFTTESTTNTSTSTKNNSSSSSTQSDGYYKTFSDGNGGKKVIKDKQEWKQVVSFVEKQYGMSEDELMNEPQHMRYDIIHKAMFQDTNAEPNNFYPKRECIVCDKVFSFPTSWNFTKYEGEAVCKSHTIGEIEDEYEKMNELDV
jgi:hypothetical protein